MAEGDTVQALVDAFNRTDVDAVLATFTEDCTIEEPPQMPDSPPAGYAGHDGVREWLGNLRGVGGVSFELRGSSAQGDALLCELASRALARGSDMPIEWRTFALFDMRGDRIARIRVFLSREEAVAAADTPEPAQENVEIVRRVISVMDAVGFEAALPVFLELAHPDVEWREDPNWPGFATYQGVEDVRQVIRDRMDTLDFDQQTEELFGVNDKVVAFVRWLGRGRTSGAEGELSMAMVWTLHDGAITKLEFFLDRDEAMAAARGTE